MTLPWCPSVDFLVPLCLLLVLIRVLPWGRIVPSPPLIYLFSHLVISVWTHRYLFHSSELQPNTIIILLFELLQLWPLGILTVVSRLVCLLDVPPPFSCLFVLFRFYIFSMWLLSRAISDTRVTWRTFHCSPGTKGPWFLLLKNPIRKQCSLSLGCHCF